MIFIYTRFNLQENQRLILQEYLPSQEIAVLIEVSSTVTTSFKPISNTKEDVAKQTQPLPTLKLSPNTILGKGQRSGSLNRGDKIQSNPKDSID